MRKVILGKTGVKVPAVSLGTWSHGGLKFAGKSSVGWAGQEERNSYDALVKAWELGITHWDTADVYGDGKSEQNIGCIWGTVPRNDIFIATKVGWDQGLYSHHYHPDLMRDQLEKSLKNLKTDIIDLYYFHHCMFGKKEEYFDDSLEMMRRFKEEGKIKFIGLSDWRMNKIMKFIDRVDPDVIQPYRNVMDDDYESSGLKRWVENHNAGVCFFSPIKHGLLMGKYTEPPEFPKGDFRSSISEFSDKKIINKMTENRKLLLEKFKDHPESILHGLLDSLLTDLPTGCVLLGQRNPDQVESASKVGTPMTKKDAQWVKSLYQN